MLRGLIHTLTAIAELAAIGTIAFAILASGAADPTAQLITSWLLLVALSASFRWPVSRLGNLRWVAPIFFTWVAWLSLLMLQFVSVPDAIITRFAPYISLIRTKFVGAGIATPRTLALIPDQAQDQWPLHALACGFAFLGAILFARRERRLRLWWFFAIIGLILPIYVTVKDFFGVADQNGIRWNSLALQDNSLAALLMLSLACLIGCLFESNRAAVREQIKLVAKANQIPVRSSRHAVRAGIEQLSRRTIWTQPTQIVLVAMAAYLIFAIAWFGSFLFCVLAFLAFLCWLIVARRLIPQVRKGLVVTVTCIVVVASGIQLASHWIRPVDPTMLTLGEQFHHWSDAIDATLNSPRVGTGIGSYGFVHLLHLDRDTRFWITDPHSLMLTWSVETGIAGMSILVLVLLLWTMLIRRLFHRRLTSTIFLSSLTVGLISGLTLLLASILDSVALTPAVLWSYVLVLGSVATTVRERNTISVRKVAAPGNAAPTDAPQDDLSVLAPWWVRVFGHPYPWTILAAGSLLLAQPHLQRQIDDQVFVDSIPQPLPDFAPEVSESGAILDKLRERIEKRPLNPQIYELAAIWELAEYRRDLVQRVSSVSERLPWGKSAPEASFLAFQRMTPADRSPAIELWQGSEQDQQHLATVMDRFSDSLARNPLQPQIHLLDAHLAPLTGRDSRRAIINAKRLAASDADVRFAIGKIGWSIQDTTLMTEQWRRLMVVPSEHTFEMLRLSRVQISPQMVVDQIIANAPASRWDTVLEIVEQNPILSPLRDAVQDGASRQRRRRDGSVQGDRQSAAESQQLPTDD